MCIRGATILDPGGTWMLLTLHQDRLKRLLLIPLGSSVLLLLGGCHQEEIPVSPNEKTAAPARLPGEDPHAHSPIRPPAGMKK